MLRYGECEGVSTVWQGQVDFPEEPPLREEGGTILKISLLLVAFSVRLKTSSAWQYVWLHPFRGMALDSGDQLLVE